MKYYTRRDVAEKLGISVQAVWKRTKKDKNDPLYIKCEKITDNVWGITEKEFNRVTASKE